MKINIIKWILYTIVFAICLFSFDLDVKVYPRVISLSLVLGFFAGLLNEILTQLKEINNKL